MRNALGVLALCGTGLAPACTAPTQTTTAALSLQALPSCELPRASRVSLRASGDFATVEQGFAAGTALDEDGLPVDTRFLAFELGDGDERAGGVLALSGADVRRTLWLLPFGRSCPFGDPLVAARDGSALAPLADGGLLIIGGRDGEGAATANALVLAPGAPLAAEVEGGLLLARVDATATPVEGGVLIAGGADDDRPRAIEQEQMRTAHDTFELYSDALGRFDMARTSKLASGPRRDHAALALPDGRVLIAGGVRALGGDPLSTVEVIDVAGGQARALDAELAFGRVRPTLLGLDSGTVLVALGHADSRVDEGGGLVREVERFDVGRERFDVVATLPEHDAASVTALEGERVAYVGCDEDDDENAPCAVALLVPAGDGFERVDLDFTGAPLLTAADGLHGLSQLRSLALHDGRMLVTGRGGVDRARRGFILDLNARTIERADLSRVPSVLLELADGSRIEANESGISLARDDAQSVLDDAPSPLIGDGATATLALDVATRWTRDRRGLAADAPARFDLPRLRFADVRIELELSGGGELLLEADRASPVAIALEPDSIALGKCAIDHEPNDAIAIVRRGERVELHSGERSRTCTAPKLGERIGIAVRAERDTRISSLRVTRL